MNPHASRGATKLLAIAALAAGILVLLAGRPGGGTVSASPQVHDCEPVRTSGSSHTGGAGGMMLGLSLDQLTDQSDIVATGNVVRLQSCQDGPGRIVTLVTVSSTDSLKGALKGGDEVTFAVRGGAYGPFRLASGISPEFTIGEPAVVFLTNDSQEGLIPTAGFQSKLPIGADGQVVGVSVDEFKADVEQAKLDKLAASQDPLTNGQQAVVESPSFATIGVRWADSDLPVPFFVNANNNRPSQLSARDMRQAVANAFHSWENLPNSYVAFGPFVNTTRTSQGDCEGLNDVTWGLNGPHNAATLAVTYTCYWGTYTFDTDVEVDTDHFGPYWRVDGSGACGVGLFDLQTVLLHEFGHVLGLDHPSGNGCNGSTCPVMDASYNGVQRTPCSDDAAGAAAVYPLGGGPVPSAPAALAALGATSVDLIWPDVSSEYGYEVWRAAVNCLTAQPADFSLIDAVPMDSTGYTDTDYEGGLAGGAYCYKVRSFNQNGTSAFSPVADAVVIEATSTAGPTATASATPSPTPTPTASPSPTPSATPTPEPTDTPSPSPSPAPTPSPTPTPSPSATPSPTPEPGIIGDLTCDHRADGADSLAVLRVLSGLGFSLECGQGQAVHCVGDGSAAQPPACIAIADVNCDGRITAGDAVDILRYGAGLPVPAIPGCTPIGAIEAARAA